MGVFRGIWICISALCTHWVLSTQFSYTLHQNKKKKHVRQKRLHHLTPHLLDRLCMNDYHQRQLLRCCNHCMCLDSPRAPCLMGMQCRLGYRRVRSGPWRTGYNCHCPWRYRFLPCRSRSLCYPALHSAQPGIPDKQIR